jgi:hypothetical protein
MAEENQRESIPINQTNNQTNAKRNLFMGIGILAGIPILILLLFFGLIGLLVAIWLAAAIIVFLLWCALLLLHSIGLV